LLDNNKDNYSETELGILNEIRDKVELNTSKKLEAVRTKDFLLAEKYKQIVIELEDSYEENVKEFKKENLKSAILEIDNIKNVISDITKIPINKLNTDNKKKLKHLNSTLDKYVVGQNEATEKITQALKRNSIGIRDENKPIGVFLFVGPTGTGKTHLSKVLANNFFTSENE
jgi:ATP-dependent Clp protease ATP-binding subunit ClpA